MKRYYLDKLNIIESIIKSIIINILITLFLFLIVLLSNLESYFWFTYVLTFIYIVVFFINIIKSFIRISFYSIGRTIMYCTPRKEEKIELDNINLIEEYYGINYLFGYKAIVLHLEKNKKKRKYSFIFKRKKADIFFNYLKETIDSGEELSDINL